MRKPSNPLKYVFEEDVPLATNRPLHLLLPYIAAIFGLVTYLTGTDLGNIIVQISLVSVVGVAVILGYHLMQRLRFKSNEPMDEGFREMLSKAASRTSTALVDEVWVRQSSEKFIKAIKNPADTALLVSTSMVESILKNREKGEVLIAWELLQVKETHWLKEFYLGEFAFIGIWAITAFEIYPYFVGPLQIIISIFGGFFVLASAGALIILILVVFAYALWYPDNTVFEVYELYGQHPVVVLNELKSGRHLTKDMASQAVSDLFYMEKKRRAERRAALAFIMSPIIALLIMPLTLMNIWLGYFIAGGPFLIIMALLTYWDDREMKRQWGFLKEEEEPVWHDNLI